jgi:hypothetical protein
MNFFLHLSQNITAAEVYISISESDVQDPIIRPTHFIPPLRLSAIPHSRTEGERERAPFFPSHCISPGSSPIELMKDEALPSELRYRRLDLLESSQRKPREA